MTGAALEDNVGLHCAVGQRATTDVALDEKFSLPSKWVSV